MSRDKIYYSAPEYELYDEEKKETVMKHYDQIKILEKKEELEDNA